MAAKKDFLNYVQKIKKKKSNTQKAKILTYKFWKQYI